MSKEQPVNASIQGLRGVAVLAVLGAHAFPHFLPGGFVGVDVFFVISGYLITSSLLREKERTGTISLKAFFARRVRRLLPAATLLLVAVAAMHPFLASIRWRDTAHQIVASALYGQNWWLATNSVDYLASEESAGALQHFWSLSIEEQFYFVWPSFLLLCFWLKRWFKGAVLGGVVLVTVVSLAYCLDATPRDPAWAYFDSFVRAWELGAGGLLAVLLQDESRGAKFALSARSLGLAGLGAALWFVKPTMLFPGIVALLPVCAALLVLFSTRGGIGGPLALRPLVFAGDISYSLYLWHWPILVLMRSVVGPKESAAHTLGALGVAFMVATLSTYFVENPVRFRKNLIGWRALALVISSWLFAALSASLILKRLDGLPAMDPAQLAAAAREDNPEIYANGCHARIPSTKSKYCEYGDPNAERTIALLGDSHAAQWQPALDEIGKATSTRVLSITKAACSIADIAVARGKSSYPECAEWRRSVLDYLKKNRVDAVILSGSSRTRTYGVEGDEAQESSLIDGYVRSVSELRQSGAMILIIADTPKIIDIPACLSARGASIQDCEDAVVLDAPADPLKTLSERVRSPYIDMTDVICPKGSCPAIVDGKVTWRDDHHMTASTSLRLSRRLRLRLSRHLPWLK